MGVATPALAYLLSRLSWWDSSWTPLTLIAVGLFMLFSPLLSGYRFRRQPGRVNFDFGFWDASVQSFWHANHSDSDLSDPMIVYQSTKDRFARRIDLGGGDIRYGYVDFDRVGYGVAVANNYDPSKARTP